jgi:uncharacterized protein (TIGR02453 family)
MKRAPKNPLDVRTALRFLRNLRKNNDRAWFAANRGVYDNDVKPQWEDFVTGLLIAASAFDERFAYIAPQQCIFRLHRDTRFTHDKSPYKSYLSAFLSPRGWRGVTPGFYISLDPGGESNISAGVYIPEKPVLTAIRARLAQGDTEFDRVLRAKRLQPYLPLDMDPLKTMPRGYDKEHPRAALIRARRFMAARTFGDRELEDGDAFAIFHEAMRDTAPLVRWLDQFVTPTEPMDDEFSEE